MNNFRYKISLYKIQQKHKELGLLDLLIWLRENCGSQGIDWCYSSTGNFCFRYKKLTRISYYDGHEHRLERFTKIR